MSPKLTHVHGAIAFSCLVHYLLTSKLFPGEGNGTLLQYSCLENPMDGGAWWATVHGVTKSQTQLSNFTFTLRFHVLLKPGLENFERYFTSVWDECNCAIIWAFFGIAFVWDWNENWLFPVLCPLLSFPNVMHQRRKWQPTPVFLPGESQGWKSLMGWRLWGRTEPDLTEAT